MAASLPTQTLPELLHRVFGHSRVSSASAGGVRGAAAGRDVLLVMPTGAGKSFAISFRRWRWVGRRW